MIQVSGDITLNTISEDDVESIFNLIDTERIYMRTWLPFVDATHTPEDTREYVKSVIGSINKQYTIRYKGEIVGLIGTNRTDLENKETEVGYWLSQKVQGLGIITRSVKKLLAYIFSESVINRVLIKVAVDNHQSRHIPEKLGFYVEGVEREGELLVDNVYTDIVVYSILKKEFNNRCMQIIKYPDRKDWGTILARPALDLTDLSGTVHKILGDIKKHGDKAVLKYEAKFDQANLSALEVSKEEINASDSLVSSELKAAIRKAKHNIELFHKSQIFESKKIETTKGVICWQKAVAIDKVGLYVPGGTAPLFSTVLMLAVPAKIAGCKEIILCSPPNKDGKIHPAILFAAKEAGVHKIFKAGGVQAIGAMAYGTESIPKMHKIFGPGNQYVMAAKQEVSLHDVAIDMPAGPSEVEVIADKYANAAFVAADLLSQAEHGADSQVILITKDEEVLQKVKDEVDKQLAELPRYDMAAKALEHSRLILLKDYQEIIDMTNEYAPEHLIIETENYMQIAEKITNAGSVFLGNYTPESAGDYASGTNHTLPTSGYAKAYSGVNLDSFVKKITFQEITKEGIQNLGNTIEVMAINEKLFAHKNAVTLRLKTK